MKKIFSLIVMCVMAMSMMAQSQLVATLTHGGTNSNFYGTNALQDALVDAQDGDLITLSPGSFTMRSGTFVFNKELIIRGNGMEGAEATNIDSPVQIEKNGNASLGLKIEGVNFNQTFNIKGQDDTSVPYVVDGVTLVKCKLMNIGSNPRSTNWRDYHGTFKNLVVIQCKCAGMIELYNESVASIMNSVVGKGFKSGSSDGYLVNVSLAVEHSVVNTNGSPDQMPRGVYRNSIINVKNSLYGDREGYYKFNPASQFVNCIISGQDIFHQDKLFNYCQSENSEFRAMNQVFKTCTNYSELVDDTYELTDEAKAILATDGTERGIYGGTAPYSPVVSYPHFTTFKVADRSVDEKLSIEIVVE